MKFKPVTFVIPLALLAAALLAWNYVDYRRQQRVDAGHFTDQYETVMQALRNDIQAVDRRMAQNGLYNRAPISEESAPPVVATSSATGTAGQVEADAVLQGISWNSNMPLAMINNRLYKAGDKVGDNTIVTILPYGLILRDAAGVEKEIRLVKEKQP
jgi:hypothetical protein